jgi:hypothetical protein
VPLIAAIVVHVTGLCNQPEEEASLAIASSYEFKYHQMSLSRAPMPIVCAQMFL